MQFPRRWCTVLIKILTIYIDVGSAYVDEEELETAQEIKEALEKEIDNER